METLTVECLACGETRAVARGRWRQVEPSECRRCGYVGWALTDDLTEVVRRLLRERPVERRRLRAV